MHISNEMKLFAEGVSNSICSIIAKEKRLSRRRPLLAVALSFIITAILNIYCPPLFAQSHTSGDIAGSVTDPTGATIPGAKVAIVDKATGASQVLTSGSMETSAFPSSRPTRTLSPLLWRGSRASLLLSP